MNQPSLFPDPETHAARCSLFLAVFPDARTARNIYKRAVELRHAHGLSGRVRPLHHLHISLHWLANEFDDLDKVVQVADYVCKAVVSVTSEFEVAFDRLLSFRGQPMKHPLVLIGDENGNIEFKKFHQLVGVNLSKISNRGNANPKFTPHMTLLYDRQIPEESISPVSWTMNEVVLVRSHVGATKYDRLAHWTLGDR